MDEAKTRELSSELSGGDKEESKVTFDDWLKQEPTLKDEKLHTEIILLSRNLTSSDQKRFSRPREWYPAIIDQLTFKTFDQFLSEDIISKSASPSSSSASPSAFATTKKSKTPGFFGSLFSSRSKPKKSSELKDLDRSTSLTLRDDDKLSLRICVMVDPGVSVDQMEAVFVAARLKGMPVILFWEGNEADTFVSYLNTSVMRPENKDTIRKLFDDDCAQSLIAKSKIGKVYSDLHLKNTLPFIRDCVGLIQAIQANPTIATFYQHCTLKQQNNDDDNIEHYYYSQRWKSISAMSLRSKGLLHLYTDSSILFGSFSEGSIHMSVSNDCRMLLFHRRGSESKPLPFSAMTNYYLIDLKSTKDDSGDCVARVRRESGLFDAESTRCTLRYQTKNGREFSIEGPKTRVLCLMPVSFDEIMSVLQECSKHKKVDWDVINDVKRMWTSMVIGAEIMDDSRFKDVSLLSDTDFIDLPKLETVKVLLHLVARLADEEWLKGSNFIGKLLEVFGDRIQKEKSHLHWTDLLSIWKFSSNQHRLVAFKRGLLFAGIGSSEKGKSALKYAVDTGDSLLIRAAMAFEKSQKSSSTLEEEMAEDHSRWASQSEYFVKNYILKRHGKKGEECVRVLMEGLMDLIKDRGDFTSVDLMGLVWFSSPDNRAALLRKLMMAMQTTLDYGTVHSDKCGWIWTRDVVMKHPVWLSEDTEQKDEGKILFHRLTGIVANEMRTKAGNDICDAFTGLIQSEKEAWIELCHFVVTDQSNILRQDEIKQGVRTDVSASEIRAIALQTNSLDFNAERFLDVGSFMTKMLIQAQLIDPFFQTLMKQALSDFGQVKFAPVKSASRVEPKSEEYAAVDRPHCRWPYTACVIDLIRCSVTVNKLSQMVAACEGLRAFVASHSTHLSIARCKNGFSKYDPSNPASLPKSYTDVKFNLIVRSEDGTRAIIGEVQILLQCVLDAKLKAHELYEVTRSLPLYKGAAHRLQTEFSFTQQLLLTGGNERLLVKPLTLSPFLFTVHNLDVSLLLKADLKSAAVIKDLSLAIVDRSNHDCTVSLISSMVSCFSSFKGGQSCFGLGSGRLISEIIERVAEIADDSKDKILLDLYQRFLNAMNEHELHMGITFNLFTHLPLELKQQLLFEDCMIIRDFKHFNQKSIRIINAIYQGFENVRGFDTFLSLSRPSDWKQFSDDHSTTVNVQSCALMLQSVFDDLNKAQKEEMIYQPSEITVEWIPFVMNLQTDLAIRLLTHDSLTLAPIKRIIRDKLKVSLNEFCDFMDQIPPLIREYVFMNRLLFYDYPSLVKSDSSIKELNRMKKMVPTIDMFDVWMNEHVNDFGWYDKQKCFPELYYCSELKIKQLFRSIYQPHKFTKSQYNFLSLFGSQRSMSMKNIIFEWTIVEFVQMYCQNGLNQLGEKQEIDQTPESEHKSLEYLNLCRKQSSYLDARSAAECVTQLVHRKDRPYFGAWIDSIGVGESSSSSSIDPSTVNVLKQIKPHLSESCNDATMEDYLAWKKGIPPIYGEWPFHSVLGIIGDSLSLVNYIIQEYPDHLNDANHIQLGMLFQVDWHSAEIADVMARHIVCDLLKDQIHNSSEMTAWILSNLSDCIAPIRFGFNSGCLLSSMFDYSSSMTDSPASSASDDDSKKDDCSLPEWTDDLFTCLNGLLDVKLSKQSEISQMLELMISLPESVIDEIPESIAKRLTADRKYDHSRSSLIMIEKIARMLDSLRMVIDPQSLADEIALLLSHSNHSSVSNPSLIFDCFQRMFGVLKKEHYHKVRVKQAHWDLELTVLSDYIAATEGSDEYSDLHRALVAVKDACSQ